MYYASGSDGTYVFGSDIFYLNIYITLRYFILAFLYPATKHHEQSDIVLFTATQQCF